MNSPYNLTTRYCGRPRIIIHDTGEVIEGHNDVVYQGADILAGLAGGKVGYNLNICYVEFQNTAGSPTPAPFAATDTALTRQAVTTPYDLLRCPLVAQPVFASSGSHYAANEATFFFLCNQTTGLNGLPFGASSNSNILSVCLVASPGGSTYTQDLLYARWVLGSPIAVSGSGQISISYPTSWT